MALSQLKDGRWIVYYRDPGTSQLRREYFGRGPAAEKAADTRNRELGFGRRVKTKPRRGPTFADIALHYVTHRTMAESTIASLERRMAVHLLPHFGVAHVASLSHRDMDRYIEKRRRSGVKNSTIRREIGIVQAIMNFAARWRPPLIPVNPVKGYPAPPPDDAVIYPPTPDEIEAILAQSPPHLQRAILLSYYLGLRPGAIELLSLDWSDVIWHRGVIMVTSAHKGGAPRREVPLHDQLAPLLDSWYEMDGQRRGPIIHFKGKRISNIYHGWRLALSRAGITRRLRPYDFRHAFVTSAIEAGADIKAVSQVVGSRPETLMKHYQHVSSEMRRATVQRIPGVNIPAPRRPDHVRK